MIGVEITITDSDGVAFAIHEIDAEVARNLKEAAGYIEARMGFDDSPGAAIAGQILDDIEAACRGVMRSAERAQLPITGTWFAVVDRHSGFVWHTCNADTPEAAAIRAKVESDGDRGFVVESLDLGDNTDRGFAVYEAPDGWECTDGQDEEQIAIAVSGRLVGFYEVKEASK